MAVETFLSASAALPVGTTLIEAVNDFARRHPANTPRKTVAEVVAEYVADAAARKLSEGHLRDLEGRLKRFASDFACPICTLSPALFRDWIRSLRAVDGKPLTNRTKFNFQQTVVGLFHFARRQHYIGRELADELAEVDLPKPEATKAAIFTTDQMRQILNEAADDILPAMAIAAFAGLRTAELQRLTWDAVRLPERVIVVGADRAKTASRRIVPMPDNLVAWLSLHARTKGPVSPAPTDRAMNHRFARTAARAGVRWHHNVLRHSAISYGLALTGDAARVSMAAGNSAAMCHKHYRQLVTQHDAKAWFDLRPKAVTNVIPMPNEPRD